MEERKRKGKIQTETNKRPNNLHEYLNSLYKDPLTFSNSIEGLYQAAIKNNRFNFSITREDIRLFLSTQPAYELAQPVKKEYRQQKRTVVSDRNKKYQMDLVDLRRFTEDNYGVQYLLHILITMAVDNTMAQWFVLSSFFKYKKRYYKI